MKITLAHDEWYGGGRRDLEITIEANSQMIRLTFCDGEPEDNTTWRNFKDIYDIKKALELAYKAGLNNETFNVEEIDLTEKQDDGA